MQISESVKRRGRMEDYSSNSSCHSLSCIFNVLSMVLGRRSAISSSQKV